MMNGIESEIRALSFIFTGISGKLGGRVYYTRNGKVCSRRHITPHNPQTGRQQARRSRFAGAVLAWRGLGMETRTEWNRRARGLMMSGYNLFIREYISRPCEAEPAPLPVRRMRRPLRAVRCMRRIIEAGESARNPRYTRCHRERSAAIFSIRRTFSLGDHHVGPWPPRDDTFP